MPLDHLVLLKLKEGTSKETVSAIIAGAASLKNIPGVLELTIGENISPGRAKGHHIGLRVTMDSEETLQNYGPCEIHQAFVSQFVKPNVEDITCVDFLF
ncbi:hypothetical protein QOT17_014500 [Balamuthia mandrillaris]